jgi:hypothetical protein
LCKYGAKQYEQALEVAARRQEPDRQNFPKYEDSAASTTAKADVEGHLNAYYEGPFNHDQMGLTTQAMLLLQVRFPGTLGSAGRSTVELA